MNSFNNCYISLPRSGKLSSTASGEGTPELNSSDFDTSLCLDIS